MYIIADRIIADRRLPGADAWESPWQDDRGLVLYYSTISLVLLLFLLLLILCQMIITLLLS